MTTIRVFLMGFIESGSDVGMTFDGNPNSFLSRVYDHGRNLGERTLRWIYKNRGSIE